MSTATVIEAARNAMKMQAIGEMDGSVSVHHRPSCCDSDYNDNDDDESACSDELSEVFRGSRSIHIKAKDSLDYMTNKEILDPYYLDPTETCSTSSFFDEDDYLLTECELDQEKCTETARVRFGQVQIREYPATIGDHPLCIDGFPLSLDWSFSDESEYDIETYECKRFLLRRNVPRRLDLDQRKDRVMETSHLTTQDLEDYLAERQKEMEMQANEAMRQKWLIVQKEAMETVTQRKRIAVV